MGRERAGSARGRREGHTMYKIPLLHELVSAFYKEIYLTKGNSTLSQMGDFSEDNLLSPFPA